VRPLCVVMRARGELYRAFALVLLMAVIAPGWGSVPLAVAEPASPAGPSLVVRVATDSRVYDLSDAVTAGIEGVISVTRQPSGQPATGVAVDLSIVLRSQAGYLRSDRMSFVTDEDGRATFETPLSSRLPGDYLLVAFAADEVGHNAYTVQLL